MISPRRLFRPPGRAHAWPRLLAAVAAPVALASTALVPASAATTAAPAARPAAVQTVSTTARTQSATAGPGQKLLSLPGLGGSSYTVTLITGDQVRLTQVRPGQYTATGIPGSGPATQIDFQSQTTGHSLTSLQAAPDEAAGLISSGQVDPGLFDLQWLIKHGDTGSAASIPVTLQYAPGQNDATLRGDAAKLPGTAVTASTPASGAVTMTVAASKAAAFWTALTGQRAATATSPASKGTAALAGGANRIWLTGHQGTAAAGPQAQDEQPQDTQPLYTVTETITRTTGPAFYCNDILGTFCPPGGATLLGVAGSGQGKVYKHEGEGCVGETQATPPVCTAWQVTYSVPAGIYYAHSQSDFSTTDDPDGTLEDADLTLDVPQFTVAGDTAISLDADKAVPVTVSTPQPVIHYGADEVAVSRILPDGAGTEDVLEDLFTQGASNWWAVPTPPGDEATIGTYDFDPELSLGAPEVTAAVTTPEQLMLHPLYPCSPVSGVIQDNDCTAVRFSGRQTLQVVNAGTGTPSEFSAIDARGKLALISPPTGYPVYWEQLLNAQQAGAAGVLLDLGTQSGVPFTLPFWLTPNQGDPTSTLPYVEIDNDEGNALLGLLAKGSVTVTVSDLGETPYAYFLRFDQEGQIPASLHYTLTSHQLAEVTSSYNAASPPPPLGGILAYASPYRPDFGSLIPSDGVVFPGPRTMRDYYGPLSPSTIWDLQADIPFAIQGPDVQTTFSQPSTSTMTWEEPPTTPGAVPTNENAQVYQAQQDTGFDAACIGCREGNTFWPIFALENGANPDVQGWIGFTAGSIQLYNQAGQQINPTTDPDLGVTTYQLPAQQARYKLVVPDGSTTTTWDFTSAEPATDQTPQGTLCLGLALGESTAPCQADPLVFLNYNANLSLTNTITPGTRQLQVTVYHQDSSAPPVTSLQLWTSTDGGTTWLPAKVIRGWNGQFTVLYTIPATGTNGYVSIKAQASDAAGNTITQQITNAYAIATAPAASTRTGTHH